MHESCRLWVRDQVFVNPHIVTDGAKVLELGSYDVNGTVRDLFPRTHYTGVDWRQGHGVDVVAFAHDFLTHTERPDFFDVVLSLNALEHDPYSARTLATATTLLRRGGILLVSCGGWYGEHEVDCAPNRHYRNLTEDDVLDGVCIDEGIPFDPWHLSRAGPDLRFAGIRG